ncbi:hypothetical protein THAOC_30919 [Thalassiosira oceanica]|uniref:Uncharacterized protein n=1 Tax=Thalassiosira oceanica TaxID=159749 RepID=K0RD26_THAOC|nr:hypothetical protein THAOC_30919 [Thalassiosira oceanica]|eukprot:EJK50144.1 hypothetical protein THAOC_30919 [Thalassiosira oceanica]
MGSPSSPSSGGGTRGAADEGEGRRRENDAAPDTVPPEHDIDGAKRYAPSRRGAAAAVHITAEDGAASNMAYRIDGSYLEGGQVRGERGRSRDQLWRTLNVCGDNGNELSTGQLGVALLDGQLSFTRRGIEDTPTK